MNITNTKKLQSILILEDDIFQAKALKSKLEKCNYTVTALTFRGTDAVAAAKNNPPDIALLDVNLDGQKIDGIEVGEALRSINEKIVIIYLTAYSTDDNFKRALASKPYDFIEKPYNMKSLERKIEMAINRVIHKKGEAASDNQQPLQTSTSARAKILCFPNHLMIHKGSNYGYTKILIKDILYIDIANVYATIHSRHPEHPKICITMSLNQLEEDLDYSKLVRVHRSYIINFDHLERVNINHRGGQLLLSNGKEIPVSRKYVRKFKKHLGTMSDL